MRAALPIDDVLPEILGALSARGRLVVQAPPGAGKTTRVPLAILEAGLVRGRIVMLEPRRLAARAAAARMAETLGEPLGQTVGYRIRGESKVSDQTQIEVVTEGILTRRLQNDPTLEGVDVLIFDEFHERSLNADLGLALALEVAGALREDLRLIAMSATLDAAPVAALMGDVPVVTSEGRAYPVEIIWRETPSAPARDVARAVAETVRQALADQEGSALVFLPGEREIREVASILGDLPDADVRPLYGAMPFHAQQAAIRPGGARRKVVLATSIAETSLTIEDIRIVVDAGLARRARFDPGSGMTRLVTEKASRAESTQRMGRAGRVSEGVCYRLWTKGEDGARPAFPPAEIEVADLTGLALELAEWGSGDLPFLTPPPEGPLTEARTLLEGLGALDANGGITAHGKDLARMPLHPRLAHMLSVAGPGAAQLAALLAERDPMRSIGVDLTGRLQAIAKGDPRADRGTLERIRAEAKRLARLVPEGTRADVTDPAAAAALAFPDGIAERRPGDQPRWLLSGGRGAIMDAADDLAGARLLVVTSTDGKVPEARIRGALPISEALLRDTLGDKIARQRSCTWSKRDGKVEAWEEERLGRIALTRKRWSDAPSDARVAAMIDGIRALGLSFSPAAERLRARVALFRTTHPDTPSLEDDDLVADLEAWLAPYLSGVETASAFGAMDLTDALKARLGYDVLRRLDDDVPGAFQTPLGRKIPIDYSGAAPEIEVRLQEMFGVTQHPRVGGMPLRVTLLSPAGRPVQTTMDLPGFWRSSYEDVRKDMRGRYPKHPWPEDPTAADPTLRAKPRGR